ncbi:MAG: DNA/RNA nuclease SfsA [Myxococcales bacterium]
MQIAVGTVGPRLEVESPTLVPHRFRGPPVEAVLVERRNRFLAICRLPGKGRRVVSAHVPDRGRCLDLLVPGQPLILVEATPGGMRSTGYTAVLARARSSPSPWVCLDPAGAPRLVEAALQTGLLPSLDGYTVCGREIALPRLRKRPRPRLDLLLRAPSGDDVLCEVKSVGAAREGVALFPDAPTLRGLRHLALLSRLARLGRPAALVFCAQRGDAIAVRADEQIDPLFARALRSASRAGVRLAAVACEATPSGMRLLGEIPVLQVTGTSSDPSRGGRRAGPASAARS